MKTNQDHKIQDLAESHARRRANTSGDRQRNQQFAKDAEKALAKIKLPLEKIEDTPALEKCPSLSPHTYKSIEIAPLSKGTSAHTPTNYRDHLGRLDELAAERDKLLKQMVTWRILAQEMTPGGSEFMTPESVRAYYRTFKNDAHQAKIDRVKLRRQVRELLAACKEIELRATQDRIASGIGKKNQTEFLIGGLERIAKVARVAVDKAESST